MSVIKPDESQLKKEQDLNLKKQKEDDERAKYLEALRASRKFQKYVIKEIFQQTLDEIFTLDRLPISDDMAKLGGVALQFSLSRKAIQKIIDKFK